MDRRSFAAKGLLLAGALLPACNGHAGSSPASALPQLPLRQAQGDEKILYRFTNTTDGSEPESALLNLNGTIYGTASEGGSLKCPHLGGGCGTIFKIETSGAGFTVLHRFAASGRDGVMPVSGVIESGGKFYGTTQFGGGKGSKIMYCAENGGCGTVFEMNPSGSGFHVIHAFDGDDGYSVFEGLTSDTSTLYGAAAGSTASDGVVFRMTKSGQETILHRFRGGKDGKTPEEAPIVVSSPRGGNALFGATYWGGAGFGTIYTMSTSGKNYRILYRFMGGSDGANPKPLFYAGGKLYGTTDRGGATSRSCDLSGVSGCGTVFEIGSDGKQYRILHRFAGGTDGAGADGILTIVDGTIYSATKFGGSTTCRVQGNPGCGTVYQIDTSGRNYRVLYAFQDGKDGAYPAIVGVIDIDGTLYGTTVLGGRKHCQVYAECGTIYAVTPRQSD
ncbi:MAG TPA: choice-of-anchor tandem repeat GloVer-containing protein [Candidatus Cybelea sp.]|nr:choice-of-anchor tandem repeat GloVer-containing protein [Candidatus Cybelea sp.]